MRRSAFARGSAHGACFVLAGACVAALALAGTGCAAGPNSIEGVMSHAFVDIDGAKTDAIIVQYANPVTADSVSADDFQITDYATYTFEQQGADGFERGDGAAAGTVTRAYVNDEPAPAEEGTDTGEYVILEVGTDYMLAGNTPAYTTTTMVGVTQVGAVSSANGEDPAVMTDPVNNYTTEEVESTSPAGETETKTVITAEADSILLPELKDNENWTIGETFEAKDCYSEYTGQTTDCTITYSIYMPQLTDEDKGNVAVDLHILDAGSLGEDPLLTLTESQGPVDLASDEVQSIQKTIIIAPQITEEQRCSNDYVATNEVNSALWQLLDKVIEDNAEYVNTDKIYGTGQSMGGMTLMDMAAQRDNFFAGFMIAGSQWSNCYNKDAINDGGARTPENDPSTFTGDYANDENYMNWYYQVSDDNILIMNCSGDQMSHGLWEYTAEYFAAAGADIPTAEWDPTTAVEAQDAALQKLIDTESNLGIRWGTFEGGDHMSTWKYSYDLTPGYQWLLTQTRQSELDRGKVEGLNNEYKGRDSHGNLISGSGTKGMNSALFGMDGTDPAHPEGWTPESAAKYLEEHPEAANQGGVKG